MIQVGLVFHFRFRVVRAWREVARHLHRVVQLVHRLYQTRATEILLVHIIIPHPSFDAVAVDFVNHAVVHVHFALILRIGGAKAGEVLVVINRLDDLPDKLKRGFRLASGDSC